MYKNRWAMLTRVNKEAIEIIHSKELAAEERASKADPQERLDGMPINDMIPLIGYQFLADLVTASENGRFWPPQTKQEHKKMEMEKFHRAIYPLWKPLEEAHEREELDSLEWVHKADWKIHKLDWSWTMGGSAGKFKKASVESRKWGAGAGLPDD